jgi:hypothetical protein
MRWLRRVRLTILHFADRTHVVADVPSSSKLLNATSQHTVAAPTAIICYIDEGYELILSLYNLPQFAYYFTSASLLAYMSLFVSLCFPRLSFYVFTVSVSLFVSLPSTLLLYHYALFFVVFPFLAPRIKFSFLLCFLASFCHFP